MGKRKVQKADSDDDLALEPEEELQEKPKKKRAPAAPKKTFSETFVDKLGWSVEPPSLIWRNFGEVTSSTKIAAFDLDSTLIARKSGATFAQSSADWRWFNQATPAKLAELAGQGYKLCVFSNQGSIKGALDGKAKEKVEAMMDLVYADLQARSKGVEVPLQVFLAPSMTPGDPCRKPATGMWQHMVTHCNDGLQPDLKASFFVGDADGSAGAHSDSDRKFAEAIGIPFKTPADLFGPEEAGGGVPADCPNADLVRQLQDLGQLALDAAKANSDFKLSFKGKAYKTAADALATFPDKITDSNLKAVNALKGVGKGTMERVKQYLKAGTVKLPEELEEEAAAGGGGAAAKPTPQQQKEALAFM